MTVVLGRPRHSDGDVRIGGDAAAGTPATQPPATEAMRPNSLFCPPRGPAWIVAVALLFSVALLSACGYSQDPYVLPNQAASLGIGVVRNRTYTGELDVRLSSVLRGLLLRNAAIRLESPDDSDLVLDVTLSRLDTTRQRSISSTDISSVTHTLIGTLTVRDTRNGENVIDGEAVRASSSLNFDQPVIETPAVRNEGLDDVVEAFARSVESRLLRRF